MPTRALADQLPARERLVAGIAPELLAHALVHALGEGFGEAIGQRLDHDGGVIVVPALEALGHRVLADAGGDSEGADVIGKPAVAWRQKIAERLVVTAFALGQLLAQLLG